MNFCQLEFWRFRFHPKNNHLKKNCSILSVTTIFVDISTENECGSRTSCTKIYCELDLTCPIQKPDTMWYDGILLSIPYGLFVTGIFLKRILCKVPVRYSST